MWPISFGLRALRVPSLRNGFLAAFPCEQAERRSHCFRKLVLQNVLAPIAPFRSLRRPARRSRARPKPLLQPSCLSRSQISCFSLSSRPSNTSVGFAAKGGFYIGCAVIPSRVEGHRGAAALPNISPQRAGLQALLLYFPSPHGVDKD